MNASGSRGQGAESAAAVPADARQLSRSRHACGPAFSPIQGRCLGGKIAPPLSALTQQLPQSHLISTPRLQAVNDRHRPRPELLRKIPCQLTGCEICLTKGSSNARPRRQQCKRKPMAASTTWPRCGSMRSGAGAGPAHPTRYAASRPTGRIDSRKAQSAAPSGRQDPPAGAIVPITLCFAEDLKTGGCSIFWGGQKRGRRGKILDDQAVGLVGRDPVV